MMKTNNYINIYTKPDSNIIIQVIDLDKEVCLRKEMKNNIVKEACLLTIIIINKYFNIQTLNTTDEDYKNVYDKYELCLVPLYISLNKNHLIDYLILINNLLKLYGHQFH